MALEFFGKKISQRKLARILKTNKKIGTLRRNMVKTARREGLTARSFIRKNLGGVKKFLADGKVVIAIFVEPYSKLTKKLYSEGDHYTIITGIGLGTVTLNDPWVGKNFKMKEKDFIGRWNKWDRWFLVIDKSE